MPLFMRIRVRPAVQMGVPADNSLAFWPTLKSFRGQSRYQIGRIHWSRLLMDALEVDIPARRWVKASGIGPRCLYMGLLFPEAFAEAGPTARAVRETVDWPICVSNAVGFLFSGLDCS